MVYARDSKPLDASHESSSLSRGTIEQNIKKSILSTMKKKVVKKIASKGSAERDSYTVVMEQNQDILRFIAETVTTTNDNVEVLSNRVDSLEKKVDGIKQEVSYIRHNMTTREEL